MSIRFILGTAASLAATLTISMLSVANAAIEPTSTIPAALTMEAASEATSIAAQDSPATTIETPITSDNVTVQQTEAAQMATSDITLAAAKPSPAAQTTIVVSPDNATTTEHTVNTDAALPQVQTQPTDADPTESDNPSDVSPSSDITTENGTAAATSVEVATDRQQNSQHAFFLLGKEIAPNSSSRLAWSPDVTISGLHVPTPVLVLHGQQPGQIMCLTAAIHGDELNGIEVVRRVMYNIKPENLHGTLIGIPIVNLQGFQRGSRYLPDRRDLNRYFPGNKQGSLAARIAYSLFHEVIQHCDKLVDIHTGSLQRNNLPQVRADMRHPDVAKFTEGFDAMVVVHSPGSTGMLRLAALQQGIVSVTLETGESMRIQESKITSTVNSIFSMLQKQQMYNKQFRWSEPEPTYYQSDWVRSEHGGILFSRTTLGEKVSKGEILGTVIDPITNLKNHIAAPYDGRIIGIAVNQVVMPGFAAYHIGVQASEHALQQNIPNQPDTDLEEEQQDMAPEEE